MYTTIADALTAVKTNPATRGLVGAEYDAYLTGLLTISAGTDPANVTQYRPFLVAAKLLEQLRSQQSIKSAEGAVFSGLATPIASLLAQQAAIDEALSLTVPAGFEVVATAAPAPTGLPRFGSISRATQIRP
ncbi:hypothetical protein [Leptolyngbya ohadii]|uniref:hypothetical protein n=1 Tax=Leptolyngbya ohadii TaxID=1962290 RepID=UPI000B59F923|nr:hypothetical protein [Leptolyngbya ohadii]